VSTDTAIQILRKEYELYFDTAERTLEQLEPAYKDAQQGVWALNTHEQVTGRIVDLITDDASDEVVLLVLEEDMLDEATADALADVSDGDISVHVGTVSESTRDHVESMAIDATVFTTGLIEWFTAMSGSPRLSRLLLVDRGQYW